MKNVETIRGLLIALNKTELEDISKTIDTLLKSDTKTELKEKGDIELFYRILNSSFNNMYPPLSVLKNQAGVSTYNSIRKTNLFLNQYLDEILLKHNKIGRKGNVVVDRKLKIVLYMIFTGIMEDWFIKINIPYSLKAIVKNYDRFPALLNAQFPGYIKSGVFVSLVLKNKRTATKETTPNESDSSYVHLRKPSKTERSKTA